MEQNSDTWYQWRREGIGASDAPVIMGKSKYQTREDLFLEKTGQAEPKPVNSFITELGHRFEPRARAYVNLMLDMEYQPQVVEMEAYKWLRASLDGWDDPDVLEIKYVGLEKITKARDEDEIPEDHWIQVQHQMMVTGAIKCLYCCYTLEADRKSIDEIHYDWIFYDRDFVINTLWPELVRFWEEVRGYELS